MALGLAETAKLAVDLSLKGNFTSALATNQKALKGFDSAVSGAGNRAYRAGTQIGTGIKAGAYIAAGALGFLATNVGLGLRSLSELDDIVTQSNAVLKSTKGVAGQTTDSLRKLAEQYESLNATIDDKVIQSGENLLLTFTNIRKDAFEPALKAALDMNTALGRGESGLQGTIQQLGVALNDPIRGLTRLQRAGITFTQTQKDQIKAAVAAGDTFKAQGIILAELNKRYGGSFLAGGSTTTGKVAKFKDAIDDLQRALATALLPTIGKVSDRLSVFLSDPKVVKTISDLGESIAGLFSDKNLAEGGRLLGTLFDTAKAAAPVLQAAAVATLNVVKTAVGLFTSLPKEVQQLAIGAFAINKITGGLVTNVAGGLIGSVLKQLVSGVVNVRGAVVNVGGAGSAGPIAGAAGKTGTISRIASVATKVFLVGAAVGAFAELAGILSDQEASNRQLGKDLVGAAATFGNSSNARDIQASLNGISTYTHDLWKGLTPEAIAYQLNIGGVKDSIDATKAELNKSLAAAVTAESKTTTAVEKVRSAVGFAGDQSTNSAEKIRSAVKADTSRSVAAVERARNAQLTSAERIRSAAASTGTKIDSARRAIAAAQRATTQAIQNKESLVRVNIPLTVNTRISVSALGSAQTTYLRYGNRYFLTQN